MTQGDNDIQQDLMNLQQREEMWETASDILFEASILTYYVCPVNEFIRFAGDPDGYEYRISILDASIDEAYESRGLYMLNQRRLTANDIKECITRRNNDDEYPIRS
jgi:hypothetical protein